MSSWSELVGRKGRYIFVNLCSLVFGMAVMRRPSGAWISTKFRDVWCAVISNVPVGAASRSGLMGCVV